MNTFKLKISAYNNILYNDQAIYCGITTLDGSLGLKARHEPVMGILKENSDIAYKDSSGTEKFLEVVNGMFSFNDNQCTIIVDMAGKK